MKRSLLLSALLLSAAPLGAWASCPTTLNCAPGKVCSCKMDESSIPREFHINYNGLAKGMTYTCTFNSSPRTFTNYPDQDQSFPVGSSHTWSRSDRRFPITLTLNTHKMSEANGEMDIKYAVPDSESPSIKQTEVSTQCTVVSK